MIRHPATNQGVVGSNPASRARNQRLARENQVLHVTVGPLWDPLSTGVFLFSKRSPRAARYRFPGASKPNWKCSAICQRRYGACREPAFALAPLRRAFCQWGRSSPRRVERVMPRASRGNRGFCDQRGTSPPRARGVPKTEAWVDRARSDRRQSGCQAGGRSGCEHPRGHPPLRRRLAGPMTESR